MWAVIAMATGFHWDSPLFYKPLKEKKLLISMTWHFLCMRIFLLIESSYLNKFYFRPINHFIIYFSTVYKNENMSKLCGLRYSKTCFLSEPDDSKLVFELEPPMSLFFCTYHLLVVQGNDWDRLSLKVFTVVTFLGVHTHLHQYCCFMNVTKKCQRRSHTICLPT